MTARKCPFCGKLLPLISFQMKGSRERMYVNCADCGLLISAYNLTGVNVLKSGAQEINESQLSKKELNWFKKKMQRVKQAKEEKENAL